MKTIILLIVGALTLSITQAQTSVWKAEKNGEALYIAGTIHLIRPADLPLPAAYFKALEQSDALYVETAIDSLQIPAVAQGMMQKMMLTDGKTLQTVLSESTYKMLEEECNKVSLPIIQLNAFKPVMTLITLSAMKLMNMGMSTEGVDKLMMKKALELNKPVRYMETTAHQINLMANMGAGMEDEFTLYSLKDMENMEKEFLKLIEEWKHGKDQLMNETIKEMKSDFPEIYSSLLAERNARWLQTMESMANNGESEMIAVGTLHLHGKEGLLEVLKSKGFKISQMK